MLTRLRSFSNVKYLKGSESLKNALTLISGSSISQILPILAAPVLARIYSPDDYGKVGVFISVSLIISISSTLQYSNAFLIPKEDSDFYALVKLCFKNVFITSGCMMVLMLLLKKPLSILLKAEAIENVFLLLPVSMVMAGITNTLSGFANRRKLFRSLAINRTIASVANTGISLVLGFWLHSWMGLLIGFMINQMVNSLIFFVILYRNTPRELILSIKNAHTEKVRKEYVSFPKFSMITDMINVFTYQIPVFMLSAFGTPAVVGLYNMCNRILGLPGMFVSGAVLEVFRQKAAEEFHETGSCRKVFTKTFKTLVLLAILPFLVLILWAPDLFEFFLGEKWRATGEIARILAPVYLLRFINAPLSFIIYFFKKLKFDLGATIYVNVTSFLALYFGLNYYSVTTALAAFSVNYSISYILLLIYSNRLSKQQIAISA